MIYFEIFVAFILITLLVHQLVLEKEIDELSEQLREHRDEKT